MWNELSRKDGATGGGISKVFPIPSYQKGIPILKSGHRGVPDVCGDADPLTGYTIYFQGANQTVGGTSAVAPLWCALIGRINQSLGPSSKKIGFINPILYQHPNVCRDIIKGNNGAFAASKGYDCCTGIGSPNGELILNLLKSLN